MQPQLCPIVPGPRQWSQSRRGSYISHTCSKVGEQCDKLWTSSEPSLRNSSLCEPASRVSWAAGPRRGPGVGDIAAAGGQPSAGTLSLLGTLPLPRLLARTRSLSLSLFLSPSLSLSLSEFTREKKITLTLLFFLRSKYSTNTILAKENQTSKQTLSVYSPKSQRGKKHQGCEWWYFVPNI